MDDLPILEVRRIEANIIKPIYEEMVRELGEERARSILATAINRDGNRHVLNLKFMDRLHTKILESNHPGFAYGL